MLLQVAPGGYGLFQRLSGGQWWMIHHPSPRPPSQLASAAPQRPRPPWTSSPSTAFAVDGRPLAGPLDAAPLPDNCAPPGDNLQVAPGRLAPPRRERTPFNALPGAVT